MKTLGGGAAIALSTIHRFSPVPVDPTEGDDDERTPPPGRQYLASFHGCAANVEMDNSLVPRVFVAANVCL